MSKKLNILKSDRTLVWTENFNNQEDLDRWLNEEKERQYWDNNLIVEIEDIEQQSVDLEKINKIIEEKKAKRDSAIEKLQILGLDTDEIAALLGD
jgi:hypothetical protein